MLPLTHSLDQYTCRAAVTILAKFYLGRYIQIDIFQYFMLNLLLFYSFRTHTLAYEQFAIPSGPDSFKAQHPL